MSIEKKSTCDLVSLTFALPGPLNFSTRETLLTVAYCKFSDGYICKIKCELLYIHWHNEIMSLKGNYITFKPGPCVNIFFVQMIDTYQTFQSQSKSCPISVTLKSGKVSSCSIQILKISQRFSHDFGNIVLPVVPLVTPPSTSSFPLSSSCNDSIPVRFQSKTCVSGHKKDLTLKQKAFLQKNCFHSLVRHNNDNLSLSGT